MVKAELAGDFTVRGLPPGRYGFSYTVEDETSVELKDSIVTSGSPEIKTGIPAAGVITIYSK
ncbi:MAG: hypothetical protein O2821_10850 [Chloroflexi bacterium]|nr:hypothetical protein [Chloroflexota bacterium]MDA1227276.1 hypothetical protein [Chloroflexota bacterium]